MSKKEQHIGITEEDIEFYKKYHQSRIDSEKNEENIIDGEECPYCNEPIDPIDIMGDSDWDDQQYNWYEAECGKCGKQYKIRQYDVETIRSFETKKDD